METPRSQTILIIDDDALDREVYKRYLRETANRSFTFAEEATGKAGLDRLKHSPTPTDCLLLDFNLPDMNGLQLLEALKNGSAMCPLPVVMLTAARDERVAVEAMKSGVMDYVPKGPATAESLSRAIDNAIEKFRMHRELDHRQHALEASEKRYRGLVEAIPQIVWTAGPDGKLEYVNSKWFEYLGVSLDHLNGLGWSAILNGEDLRRFSESWTAGLKSGEPFEFEHRLPQPDGTVLRWYLSRAVPMRDDAGRLTKWFGTSTDIEDRKKTESAVLSKQKLESLGLLAGGIAHDFNNLLVGILGGASFAAETLPPSHPMQATLQGIVTAGERAAHLTRQMLAYAGKGRFFIEQIDIGELVRSTCDLIKASIPKHVTLSLDLCRRLPFVEADSSQMQQIVMNLVLNAAEATTDAARGTVAIKTDLVLLDEAAIARIECVSGSLVAGPYVLFQVQDNGCGMDAETQARIFDPFFTTKFTGRGLGLSAVQGILRTHKGAIELTSLPGQGSTFKVYLPTSPKARIESALATETATRGAGTILIVDDEEIVLVTAKASLERAGFKVLTADKGEKAIGMLLSTATPPISLVLLDMGMPDMNGKQVMQQIRELGLQVPVLICSGYSEDAVFREFSGLDIAGFAQKPFTSRQIAAKVSGILSASGRKI
jgi:PAS domain S-box-containing protein